MIIISWKNSIRHQAPWFCDHIFKFVTWLWKAAHWKVQTLFLWLLWLLREVISGFAFYAYFYFTDLLFKSLKTWGCKCVWWALWDPPQADTTSQRVFQWNVAHLLLLHLVFLFLHLVLLFFVNLQAIQSKQLLNAALLTLCPCSSNPSSPLIQETGQNHEP